MDLSQAVILGVVQGLTEFLPISSSAHLVLIPWLLGWNEPGLAFDAALHLGTLAALLAYFWRDWLSILRGVLAGLQSKDQRGTFEFRMGLMLILGSVPAAIIGVLFEKAIESEVRTPVAIAGLMVSFALVLLVAERIGSQRRSLNRLTLVDALVVGMAQALALAPGVSRSGSTITAGLFLGLDRTSAARFSFLLSTPIVIAAGSLQLVKLLHGGLDGEGALNLVAGVLVAAVTGLAAISLMLRFLQRNKTDVFAWYRITAGLCVLLVAMVKA